MKISQAYCGKEVEPLQQAFRFKGSALTQLWQTVVHLKSEKNEAVGLGVQSVLWADDKLFAAVGEDVGNDMMFQITQRAEFSVLLLHIMVQKLLEQYFEKKN